MVGFCRDGYGWVFRNLFFNESHTCLLKKAPEMPGAFGCVAGFIIAIPIFSIFNDF
jgi:hypothetical protein